MATFWTSFATLKTGAFTPSVHGKKQHQRRFSFVQTRIFVVVAFGCLAGLPFNTAVAAPPGSDVEAPAAKNTQPPRLLGQIDIQYPDEALESGVHGDVSVLVDIDASGRVIESRFEAGPDVFREEALSAASKLSFSDNVPCRMAVDANNIFLNWGMIGATGAACQRANK